jgi:hypothetical protein
LIIGGIFDYADVVNISAKLYRWCGAGEVSIRSLMFNGASAGLMKSTLSTIILTGRFEVPIS